MLFLFALTLFVSALLLFLVQPIVAKMVLPILGGTPAVWNTCQLFFQAALLLGYFYAFASTKWLSRRTQILVHLAFTILPLSVLPIRLIYDWVPDGDANPTWGLLGLLAVSAGLPFLLLSTSAPLLQNWFSLTGHPHAKDPYFLYAASNLGSMIALLSYPAVVEPFLPLKHHHWLSQSILWTIGYALLVALVTLCAISTWKSLGCQPDTGKASRLDGTEEEAYRAQKPTWGQMFYWVALGFVPSCMMLAVTMHITLDIAAIPLFWILTLSLYILSFIIVFARWSERMHRGCVMLMPLVVLVLVFLYIGKDGPGARGMILLNLAALFMVSLVCHGQLALSRPSVRYLTTFYLLMSFGGALGGVFNAIIAPRFFSSVLEYPLVLVLACMVLPQWGNENPIWPFEWVSGKNAKPLAWLVDYNFATVLGLFTYFLLSIVKQSTIERIAGTIQGWLDRPWIKSTLHFQLGEDRIQLIVLYGIPIILCYAFVSRPIRFGLSVAGIMLGVHMFESESSSRATLLKERSYFGVLTVTENDQRASGHFFHSLNHGTTLHGTQDLLNPAEPLTYYHRNSPIGEVFETFKPPHTKHPNRLLTDVALIGLGSGSLAAYGEMGMKLTIYDIDPAVVAIAENENYFTYLKNTQATYKIILGDARLQMDRKAPDGAYDLIVVDAFSSDAIPVHLLTREAVEMYRRKLKPNGILALHISNRHLDLGPVVAAISHDLGLFAIRSNSGFSTTGIAGATSSDWCLAVNKKEDLCEIAAEVGEPLTSQEKEEKKDEPKWVVLHPESDVKAWTDDFSNLLGVFNRQR